MRLSVNLRVVGVRKRMNKVVLIILMIPDIISKTVYYLLVVAFRLAARTGVVGGCHEWTRSERDARGMKEPVYRPRSIIGQKTVRYSIRHHPRVQEYLAGVCGCRRFSWNRPG